MISPTQTQNTIETTELALQLSQDKIELIRNTICKGSTKDELSLFLHACKRTGLDPFMKQIYAVKRFDSKLGREVMTIQTGIDGYRLIAERTGKYSPGKETVYTYTPEGKILSATAYVKKQTPDGTWHEVAATAFFSEYAQTDKRGEPSRFWKQMGHAMISKCAESLALRRAFPAELSGIYTSEEMIQANKEEVAAECLETVSNESQIPLETIAITQAFELTDLIDKCPLEDRTRIFQYLKSINVNFIEDLPANMFDKIYKRVSVLAAQEKGESNEAV